MNIVRCCGGLPTTTKTRKGTFRAALAYHPFWILPICVPVSASFISTSLLISCSYSLSPTTTTEPAAPVILQSARRYHYVFGQSAVSQQQWHPKQSTIFNRITTMETSAADTTTSDRDFKENGARSNDSYSVPLTVCPKCRGEGKLYMTPRKARKRYKQASNDTISNNNVSSKVAQPQKQQQQQQAQSPSRIDGCKVCQGSGLVEKKGARVDEKSTPTKTTMIDEIPGMPHVAIIGGGLGGLALAVACRHRGIPFAVYERDGDFFQRSQGYGLTMQQASRALKALGIQVPLAEGIVSTKHIVHTPEGRVVGEWGLRKWIADGNKKAQSNVNNDKKSNKRQNVHIARQSLRFELLKALGGPSKVKWGHRLVEFTEHEDRIDLVFEVNQSTNTKSIESDSTDAGNAVESVHASATLLVGADGIRSTVRRQWLGEDTTPLRYLGCIVILGICPLGLVVNGGEGIQSPLLDGKTVFQTADGSTRIYMMPFSTTQYMWQLSFPMEEQDAKSLSLRGPQALKEASLKMCKSWHDPITQILQNTPASMVSGYPVYDRELLTSEVIRECLRNSSTTRRVILLGDACHPMSPFKGQGANQALLDALSLARILFKNFTGRRESSSGTGEGSNTTGKALLKDSLETHEQEMLARSSVKVQASAEAARFLHTEIAIQEGDVTRGAAAAHNCNKSLKV